MDEENNKKLGELLVQLSKGNVAALTEIANLLENLLMSIGNVYYQNRADVEDAIQNLYLKLFDTAKNFRRNSNACAWVITVFENTIKSHLRRIKREERLIQEQIIAFQASWSAEDEKYLDNHIFVKDTFTRLSREEQKILIYYHWCKCTVREIAAIMRKSKSAIHKKLKNIEIKIKNFQK